MRVRLRDQHGWRKFLGEVGTIVLGVLIALGAEQLVSNYLAKKDANYAEAAFKAELHETARSAVERLAIEPCLKERISHLHAKLQREGESWTADRMVIGSKYPLQTVLPAVYRPPRRAWKRDAWQMAMTSDVLKHMPRERVSAYSSLYYQMGRLRDANDHEIVAARRLGPLSGDRQLDRQLAFEVSTTLHDLDLATSAMGAQARLFLNLLREMRLGYTRKENDFSSAISDQREMRGSCVRNIQLTI